MTPIKREPLLSAKEASKIADQVMRMRAAWVDRGGFWTLGGARYLDRDHDYSMHQIIYNAFMLERFSELYELIEHRFPYAEFHDEVCHPGFHIFTDKTNGVEPSIHQDISYEKIDFGEPVTEHISFTLALRLPKGGAGLYVIDTDGKAHYHEYHQGFLYTHKGKVTHQIANDVTIQPGEYRITMQGHIAKAGDRWFFYF